MLQIVTPELQWSHVFSDMVRASAYDENATLRPASMEPCLFRHGKVCDWNTFLLNAIASMEPCLFRHGKERLAHLCRGLLPGFNGAMSFQTW